MTETRVRNLSKVPNYHPTVHVAVAFAFAGGCILVSN